MNPQSTPRSRFVLYWQIRRAVPAAVIERLNVTMNRVLPELRERYFNLGMDLGGGTAAEFGAFLKSELEKWARVVKISGAKVE